MTDAQTFADQGSAAPPRRRFSLRKRKRATPIVPAGDVAGRAMVLVIAIMTFLSCLSLGGVTLVRDTASSWQSQISREATIEIKPSEGADMEAALAAAPGAGTTPAAAAAAAAPAAGARGGHRPDHPRER